MINDGSSHRLDLDGLQVFEAIMRERNVTRAAVAGRNQEPKTKSPAWCGALSIGDAVSGGVGRQFMPPFTDARFLRF